MAYLTARRLQWILALITGIAIITTCLSYGWNKYYDTILTRYPFDRVIRTHSKPEAAVLPKIVQVIIPVDDLRPAITAGYTPLDWSDDIQDAFEFDTSRPLATLWTKKSVNASGISFDVFVTAEIPQPRLSDWKDETLSTSRWSWLKTYLHGDGEPISSNDHLVLMVHIVTTVGIVVPLAAIFFFLGYKKRSDLPRMKENYATRITAAKSALEVRNDKAPRASQSAKLAKRAGGHTKQRTNDLMQSKDREIEDLRQRLNTANESAQKAIAAKGEVEEARTVMEIRVNGLIDPDGEEFQALMRQIIMASETAKETIIAKEEAERKVDELICAQHTETQGLRSETSVVNKAAKPVVGAQQMGEEAREQSLEVIEKLNGDLGEKKSELKAPDDVGSCPDIDERHDEKYNIADDRASSHGLEELMETTTKRREGRARPLKLGTAEDKGDLDPESTRLCDDSAATQMGKASSEYSSCEDETTIGGIPLDVHSIPMQTTVPADFTPEPTGRPMVDLPNDSVNARLPSPSDMNGYHVAQSPEESEVHHDHPKGPDQAVKEEILEEMRLPVKAATTRRGRRKQAKQQPNAEEAGRTWPHQRSARNKAATAASLQRQQEAMDRAMKSGGEL